jgi:hypothetical protein
MMTDSLLADAIDVPSPPSSPLRQLRPAYEGLLHLVDRVAERLDAAAKKEDDFTTDGEHSDTRRWAQRRSDGSAHRCTLVRSAC